MDLAMLLALVQPGIPHSCRRNVQDQHLSALQQCPQVLVRTHWKQGAGTSYPSQILGIVSKDAQMPWNIGHRQHLPHTGQLATQSPQHLRLLWLATPIGWTHADGVVLQNQAAAL